MFVLLFILWILFNGKLTWEIAIFGLVLSAAVYAFCCAFLGYSWKGDWKAVRRLPACFKYLGLVITEIAKSNLALIRAVYGPDEVHPRLVTFSTPLKGQYKSVLADSITLTPGTISVFSEDDKLVVHCLDTSFAEGIEETAFQQQLEEMQKEEQA